MATMNKWNANKRAASPGAPAPGVCPDFINGKCALGVNYPLEHNTFRVRVVAEPKQRRKGKGKGGSEAEASAETHANEEGETNAADQANSEGKTSAEANASTEGETSDEAQAN